MNAHFMDSNFLFFVFIFFFIQGLPGNGGIQGLPGEKGEQGDHGEAGKEGLPGPKGKDLSICVGKIERH